jgi:hypothetical protein
MAAASATSLRYATRQPRKRCDCRSCYGTPSTKKPLAEAIVTPEAAMNPVNADAAAKPANANVKRPGLLKVPVEAPVTFSAMPGCHLSTIHTLQLSPVLVRAQGCDTAMLKTKAIGCERAMLKTIANLTRWWHWCRTATPQREQVRNSHKHGQVRHVQCCMLHLYEHSLLTARGTGRWSS